jgi:hypothetical protein
MGALSDQWIRPKRARESFPPYRLFDRDLVAAAEERTRKLARIYHVSQEQAWDGRKVLASLVEKHGGVRVPEDKKAALGKIASILLWGELAAWSISADLALKLEDTEAKMAATSQVFDEARHFYVLRDYLWQAGIELPPLGGHSRKLLVELLETDNLLYKIVGMQLLVENMALVLFKMIAAAEIEPVLTELLPYFERDEARHVGLGVLALPSVLPALTPAEARKLHRFQLKVNLRSLFGGLALREEFSTLGVDQNEMQRYSFKLQHDVLANIKGEGRQGEGRRGAADRETRGLFKLSRVGQKRLNTFLFPPGPPEALPAWHRTALGALIGSAKALDRFWA